MPQFDYDAIKAPAPMPAFKEAERRTPDHMGNVLILLAFAAGCVVLYIILAAMILSDHRYLNIAGWLGMFTVFGILILVFVDRDSIRTVETIIGHDIDQDGYIGQPPSVAIETHYSPTQMEVDKLPGPPQMIEAWARTALEDGSLAYSVWADRFGSHVTPMGRKVELYRAFREVCRARKLITEQGTHSCELTAHGRDYFEAMLRGKQTPLLEG